MDLIFVVTAVQAILAATLRMATPLIYAAVGEVFAERSGVINIGLEGFMLLGAFAGFATTFYTGSLALGLIAAIASGLVAGLLFALFTVTIQANQIVVGAAFNMIGLGLTGFLYRALFATSAQRGISVETFPPVPIPLLSRIPFLGEVLSRQNVLVYGALLLVPIAAFGLYRTAFGLSIRAAGEHPRAADTAGINVTVIRYVTVLIGGVLAAIGGAFLTLAHANQFVEAMTSGRGFIALAVVVFGRWSPWGALGASLLFGVFFALQLRLQAVSELAAPYQFLQALPYIATLLVLVGIHGRARVPKALGVPYKS